MARQPEVFVRELDPAEAQRLVKIARTARDRVRLRRAGIVLASVQGRSAAEAAAMFAATAKYAREVIHAFNEQGFAALDPKWSGGRPRRFGPAARELICRVAKTAPQQAGLPFTTWSLTKLVEHLRERHRIVASTETVRQILREAGIRWQATKTCKGSRDPDFTAKMARILDLYDIRQRADPRRGRVICVDEFGPLNCNLDRTGAGSRATRGTGTSAPAAELNPVVLGERSRIGKADHMRLADEQPDSVWPRMLDPELDRAHRRGHARMATVVVAVAGTGAPYVFREHQASQTLGVTLAAAIAWSAHTDIFALWWRTEKGIAWATQPGLLPPWFATHP